jgi:hypothetical protein
MTDSIINMNFIHGEREKIYPASIKKTAVQMLFSPVLCGMAIKLVVYPQLNCV